MIVKKFQFTLLLVLSCNLWAKPKSQGALRSRALSDIEKVFLLSFSKKRGYFPLAKLPAYHFSAKGKFSRAHPVSINLVLDQQKSPYFLVTPNRQEQFFKKQWRKINYSDIQVHEDKTYLEIFSNSNESIWVSSKDLERYFTYE